MHLVYDGSEEAVDALLLVLFDGSEEALAWERLSL
jgi:hypothetical protein